MELNEFPDSWIISKVDDLGELIRGISYKKEDASKSPSQGCKPILRANNINGHLNFNELVYVPARIIREEQYIKKGDLIFAMSSGSKHLVGKSAPALNDYDGSYGAFCALLRPSKYIDQSYFAYFFQGNTFRKLVSEIAKGTNINNLKREHILDIDFPFPSPPEQHCISDKIEKLCSELDNGIENLKKAREQLKTYRQAVLKYAFEGKLTKEWRTQHLPVGRPKKPKELRPLLEEELSELPVGWKWEQIKEITTVLGDGLHGTPIYSDEGDYYFINGNNLSDGKIEIKENTKRVTIEEYEKYKKPLSENTVLVSINGTLGNTAFYNGEKVILGKSACYFNVLNTIDKYYIRYYITSQRFINYAHKNATGSTIKNVSLKAMREFEISIPPTLEEQQAIVSEIESRLSVCDKLEQTIEDSLIKAEALRQSILKKAFAGELTKDWREKHPELIAGENSAEKLLAKIKAEKAKAAAGRKKPQSKKKKEQVKQ